MSSSNTFNAGNSGRLRRSARAPKKSTAEYSVGDIVEIQRGGGTFQVRLIQLLTEGTSSPNPRWLIRSVSGSQKDEEVYEHIFVSKVSSNENSHLDEDRLENNHEARPTNSPVSSSSIASSQQVEAAMENSRSNGGASKRKKTLDGTAVDGTATYSDSSTAARNGARGGSSVTSAKNKLPPTKSKSNDTLASSREARSRRRQGIVRGEGGEDMGTQPAVKQLLTQESVMTLTDVSTVEGTRKRKGGTIVAGKDGKRDAKPITSKTTSVSAKKEEEECLKIKFLTGTLYLYRGRHRRAEFVRRV